MLRVARLVRPVIREAARADAGPPRHDDDDDGIRHDGRVRLDDRRDATAPRGRCEPRILLRAPVALFLADRKLLLRAAQR